MKEMAKKANTSCLQPQKDSLFSFTFLLIFLVRSPNMMASDSEVPILPHGKVMLLMCNRVKLQHLATEADVHLPHHEHTRSIFF